MTELREMLVAIARGDEVPGEIVRHLRPRGVVGSLVPMPLTEILQNMDFGKRSGRVDVWIEDAAGSVHVHDGQIVAAQTTTNAGAVHGEAAVLELCRRTGGVFSIGYEREDVERNVHRPTTFVLLEALRVIDESAPKPGAPAAIDLGPAPLVLDEAVDDALETVRIHPRDLERPSGGDREIDAWAAEPFPPLVENTVNSALDEPSSLDIEVASDAEPEAPAHPRFKVGAVIGVGLAGGAASLLLEDISLSGAFLRTREAPPRDSEVILRLPSGSGAVAVKGRVMHVLDAQAAASVSREPGIAVAFENLPPDVATRLQVFIDDLPSAGAAKDKLMQLVAESQFLVAAGDLERAQRVLSQAQGLAPGDDDVRRKLLQVNETIDAAQANRFLERAMRGGPQAVELARRATQLRPVREVLLRSLAVFARGGAFDEVADVAEQLLELDPTDEGALRTLLDANVAMKRWPVASRALESLLKLHPSDAQLLAMRERIASGR